MIKTVVMPKLGTTMREGVLTDWHKTVGDYVTAGDVLLSVESNKANVEVESVATGYLIKILCDPGETRAVNEVVGLIADTPGEDADAFLAALAESQGADSAAPKATGTASTGSAPPPILPRAGEAAAHAAGHDGKVKALPKARALAKRLGLDLTAMTGSGKDGMITVADVEKAQTRGGIEADGAKPTPIPAPKPAPSVQMTPESNDSFRASPLAKKIAAAEGIDLSTLRGTGSGGKIMRGDLPLNTRPSTAAMDDAIRRQNAAARPDGHSAAEAAQNTASNTADGGRRAAMSPMRRAIAENMTASLARSAQACHRLSIDMTRVKEIRAAYAEKGTKVSLNDILVAAAAQALVEHRIVNASSDGNGIIYHADVNVGLAVALDEGLIVPNVKKAQNLSIPEIAARSKELIEKAKSGTLAPSDYKGGTFTVTNLGMFDIEDFVAIINPPEAAILAVGRILDRPVVRGGEIVVRPMMTVCLTYDHRILDGAPAAAFLKRIKELLEEPIPLLIKG